MVGRRAGRSARLRCRRVAHRVLRGDRLDLRLGVTQILKVAVVEEFHRVAGRADFLIDLKPALQRRLVVGAENAVCGQS